jgi:hypothetical protein
MSAVPSKVVIVSYFSQAPAAYPSKFDPCVRRAFRQHAQTKDAVILPPVLLDKGIGCQRRVKAGVADKVRIEPLLGETHR